MHGRHEQLRKKCRSRPRNVLINRRNALSQLRRFINVFENGPQTSNINPPAHPQPLPEVVGRINLNVFCCPCAVETCATLKLMTCTLPFNRAKDTKLAPHPPGVGTLVLRLGEGVRGQWSNGKAKRS